MTKIDVFSGFLGAGKTTLIKKLIKEAYKGEKLVLIENEFGEIGIDGGFMQEAGIEVTEMNSGCICCSLTGDFRASMREVVDRFAPDRILIEPSGVGKLSDIVTAVEQVEGADLVINALGTVVDAAKAKMYMRNFGEFFNNQVESAGCIILSRTGGMSADKIAKCVELLRGKNPGAVIITTPWEELSGEQILSALERRDTLAAALESMEREQEAEHGHEHHHHHHHDGDHDADEVFTSWGLETAKKFTEESLREKLEDLSDSFRYGHVLRAKGIVDAAEGEWFHFDYTPGEIDIRRGSAGVTGRLCVIGAELKEDAVAELFNA